MEDNPENTGRDPYKGIRGPDTPLTPWEKLKKDFHDYIEGEKKCWEEMKETFIRIGIVYGCALMIMSPIVDAISKLEQALNSTLTESTNEYDQECNDPNLTTIEGNKKAIEPRRSNFVPQIDTEPKNEQNGEGISKEIPKEDTPEEEECEEIK